MTWQLALQATPAVIGAFSSLKGGSNAKSAGNYNAALAGQAASAETSAGYRNEEAQRRASAQLRGKQRAIIAQSGGDYGGTNALLLDQSDANAELDALNTRTGGLMRGAKLRAQAALYRLQGGQTSSQSGLLAGAQLLRGASDVYTGYQLGKT